MNKIQLEIRKAEKGDLKQINYIAKQVHELHVDLRPDIYVSQEEIISSELLDALLSEGVVFLGEYNNKIICYAVCFIRQSNNPILTNRRVIFIDAIAIDEDYQRRGVGKKLMEHIFDFGKTESCEKVELQVNTVNSNAIEFYKHLKMKEKTKTFELEVEK